MHSIDSVDDQDPAARPQPVSEKEKKKEKNGGRNGQGTANRRDEPLAKTLRLNHNQSTGRLHRFEA